MKLPLLFRRLICKWRGHIYPYFHHAPGDVEGGFLVPDEIICKRCGHIETPAKNIIESAKNLLLSLEGGDN